MEPRVYRGVGFSRAALRLLWLVTLYGGGFAILWGLGLAVRGWQGWALIGAPLAALIVLRLWAWRRISVEVADGKVRYEGAVPTQDWEVALDRVSGTYFDRALPGAPLVVAFSDGDERACLELSKPAARALHAHLCELGVATLGA